MIYAMSDTHGYPIDKIMSLLQKVGFSDNDFLFVLGDVIDRGSDGVKMLQWMMQQPNVELILGNHEAMLLSCDFILDEVTDDFLLELDSKKMSLLSSWQQNGAAPTIKGLAQLSYDKRQDIIEYLREAELFDIVSAGDRDFLLTHSGLGNFSRNKKLSEYEKDDFLWNRPSINTEYFDEITVVFGHTPTFYYGDEYRGKILKTKTWVDIDAGAADGLPPALLCLDTMKEIYLSD